MTTQQIIHKSMRGNAVDMNKLMNQNEMTLAVGNVKVNARGDEIGPGGKIIAMAESAVTAGGMGIQAQTIRNAPTQPTIESQPVKQAKPVKDVSTMDPEGNE